MKHIVFLLFAATLSFAQQPSDLLAEAKQRPPKSLADFEDLALHNNPTLEQANSLVRLSAGLAQQAGLFPNPSVGYQGEQIRGGSYHGGEQGAYVEQNIPLGGKLAFRRNVEEQARQTAVLGVEEQRQRILAEVDRFFYRALATQEAMTVREQLLAVALDTVNTSHQLANVGQSDSPDILEAEVEAEQARLDSATAQRTYLAAFASLAAAAGQPDLSVTLLTGTLENDPALDTDHLLEKLTHDSPALKRAEQGIAHAEAQLKSAAREAAPDLQIRAGLQNNFESLNPAAPSTRVGVQGFASAGITLPLFNRNQGNRLAAEAELDRAHAEVQRIRLLLTQAAQPEMERYLSAKMQADRYKSDLLPRAEKAHQLYLSKYREMASAYTQVLVSQRTLFNLHIAYLGVLEQLWTSASALNHFLLSGALEQPDSEGAMRMMKSAQ